MRTTIPNVECPKCKHKFTYDSGWNEFIPYKTKKEAEKEARKLNKKYPDMEWSAESYFDGYMISGRSK